jgi:hypothetical protein
VTTASLVAVGVEVGLNDFAVGHASGALDQESRRWRIATATCAYEVPD